MSPSKQTSKTTSTDEILVVSETPPAAGAATTPFPQLTDREREVAIALVEGDRNSEIAADLRISIKTVDTHRSHILKKLNVRNNVELCRLAIREGYIEA